MDATPFDPSQEIFFNVVSAEAYQTGVSRSARDDTTTAVEGTPWIMGIIDWEEQKADDVYRTACTMTR